MLTSLLLVAALAAPGGYCQRGETCYQTSPGETCWGLTVAECPVPKALVREGDLFWRPPADEHYLAANYVQGPWAVQWQDRIYNGFHAGHFGEPWYVDGGERPVVIEYGPDRVVAQDRVLDLPVGTHEFGFGSMVRVNGWWLYSAIYTRWGTLGQENRSRLMLAMTEDPMKTPYPYVWWDLPLPAGGIMSAPVWVGPRLLLFYGDSVYQVAIHEAGPYKAPAIMRISDLPVFPWSDIALGDDGRLYALVSGVAGVCWWWDCDRIEEYFSEDEGLTWTKGERSWRIERPLPGGLMTWIGDACYLRDELGHIRRDALVVIALVTPTDDPASNTWYLHYWADAGAQLSRTWGLDPGAAIPRRHLEIGK